MNNQQTDEEITRILKITESNQNAINRNLNLITVEAEVIRDLRKRIEILEKARIEK